MSIKSVSHMLMTLLVAYTRTASHHHYRFNTYSQRRWNQNIYIVSFHFQFKTECCLYLHVFYEWIKWKENTKSNITNKTMISFFFGFINFGVLFWEFIFKSGNLLLIIRWVSSFNKHWEAEGNVDLIAFSSSRNFYFTKNIDFH